MFTGVGMYCCIVCGGGVYVRVFRCKRRKRDGEAKWYYLLMLTSSINEHANTWHKRKDYTRRVCFVLVYKKF